MTEVLTFIFAFMIFYNLFKWLGATERRRRQYRYSDNGTWIAIWAVAFSMSDWASPGDAGADTSESIDMSDYGGGDGGGAGCGGCGG